MSSNTPPSDVLAEANQIINTWSGNPEFKLGEITLAKFKAEVDALQEADNNVEFKRTELTRLINDRDTQKDDVHELVTRARSGFRGAYGPDSTQYEQAGGTRTSERKKPSRRSTDSQKKAA